MPQPKTDEEILERAKQATKENRERIAKAKALQERWDNDPKAHPIVRKNPIEKR
jgi:hypothetical protein